MMKTHVHRLLVYLAVLIVTVLIGAAGAAAAEPLVIVVPNGMDGIEGEESTWPPAEFPPVFLDGARLQDIVSESQFAALEGPMWLTRMAWRPDKQMVAPLTTTLSDYELWLSTTTRDPLDMSTTFADNSDGPATRVFKGDITWSIDGSGSPDGPRGFDLVVDLQTPFLYNPAQGHFVYDQRYSEISEPFSFDRWRTVPDRGLFRWIMALEPDLPVGFFHPTDEDATHNTYVHQFTFIPDSPIDIKPGSDPNSINLKSKGVLPVSILGTEELDVRTIDPPSVRFGDPALIDVATGILPVEPIRWSYEDVTHDGQTDLSFKFGIQDMISSGVLGASTLEGLLTGSLLDGTPIIGTDFIRIVPKHAAAVPEPSTAVLSALGLLCLVACRRNRW
jgi:hypothetical protein